MPRKDRVGSYVTFCDHSENEHDGKIVRRKKNGDLIVLCLTGRNRGNSKRISPDQIVSSSAVPDDLKEMIEQGHPTEYIVEGILQEKTFKKRYTVGRRDVKDIIKYLKGNIPKFKVGEEGDTIWGYIEGSKEALFRYNKTEGRIYSDYSQMELELLKPEDL